MSETRPTDLASLTSIRGIAAWFVVLYHVRSGMGGYTPDWAMAVLAKGYLAVDLFFMLSGFVLWLNYAERLREGGLAAAPAFYRRRIARIWPLHAFILLGLLAFAMVLVATGRGDPQNYPLAQLPLHLAMLQNWGFTTELSWNHPAWSISCEFAAYLLFPLLALAADWRRIGTPWLISGMVALAALLWAMIATPGLGDDIPRLGLRRCLIEFTMGTMLCALWQHSRTSLRAPLISGTATITAGIGWLAGLPESFAAPLLFAALLATIALADAHPRNPLRARFSVWLGDISYATYLVHVPLFVLFKLLMVEDASYVAPATLALFLVVVMLGSALLHRLIERPAQRALNGLRSPFPRAAAA